MNLMFLIKRYILKYLNNVYLLRYLDMYISN